MRIVNTTGNAMDTKILDDAGNDLTGPMRVKSITITAGDVTRCLIECECVQVDVVGDLVERRPDFQAWNASPFPDGEIVEVRERDGTCKAMMVGSIQFQNALRDLGSRMPVRAATAEQRKGWGPTS